MRLRIVLVGALSLALSGISILCCYVFGTHLAPGLEGQLYGVLGGVADALKAFLPLAIAAALAARQKGRAAAGAAMFAVFSLYSFTSELGLYALGRNAVASDAQAGREAYEAAKADRGRIEARLKELRLTADRGHCASRYGRGEAGRAVAWFRGLYASHLGRGSLILHRLRKA